MSISQKMSQKNTNNKKSLKHKKKTSLKHKKKTSLTSKKKTSKEVYNKMNTSADIIKNLKTIPKDEVNTDKVIEVMKKTSFKV